MLISPFSPFSDFPYVPFVPCSREQSEKDGVYTDVSVACQGRGARDDKFLDKKY